MGDVLVDTSAWIEFFNHPSSRWGEVLDLLLGEERVCTTDLVIAEVVSGAKNRSEFERLRADFKKLPLVSFLPSLWDQMLESRWQLKRRGVTGIGIPDLMVAHIALAHRKILFTLDRDFLRMRPVLTLELLELS